MVVRPLLLFHEVLEKFLAIGEVVAVGVRAAHVGRELEHVVVILAGVSFEGVECQFAGLPLLVEGVL